MGQHLCLLDGGLFPAFEKGNLGVSQSGRGCQSLGVVSQTITIMGLYSLVVAIMCHHDTKFNE